ncbi:hypothetical protein K438DRAFT_1968484 [Mycena galopus ATCC 62051]|nr:hypothetical protein K438DRAFT_1968484 [Mycena galopus ATCC 62051]
MATCGNRGYFHGEPLEFLLGYVPQYLALSAHKKKDFWMDFDTAWNTAYPKITPEEMGELEEEEANLADAITNTRALNEQALKGKSRRKAVILLIPIPGARLCELRARAADKTKTKDKTRKVEPFRAWLNAILSAHGPPRRIKMGWALWRDPAHGEALQVLYREKFAKNTNDDNGDREGMDGFEKEDSREEEDEEAPVGRAKSLHNKYRLAMEYFKQLNDDEQAKILQEREEDYVLRRAAHQRTKDGVAPCTTEELSEPRHHVESISQWMLNTICAQMKCQGILMLGEIVDGGEDDEDKIFLSMVQHGALPKHPDAVFTKWVPVRSKAMLQVFADFLVARKKDEHGLLGSLTDTDPPNLGTPSLCMQCMGSLTPLPWDSPQPLVVTLGSVEREHCAIGARRPGENCGGNNGHHRKGKKAEEKEAEEEEEEEEDTWPGGGSDDEEDDSEEDEGEEDDEEEEEASTPPPIALMRMPKTPLRKAVKRVPAVYG